MAGTIAFYSYYIICIYGTIVPFENRTIWRPDMFGPFENQTSPVFRWLLYFNFVFISYLFQTVEFDDIFLERIPSQENLGQHIVALLNSTQQGKDQAWVKKVKIVLKIDGKVIDICSRMYAHTCKIQINPV